MALKDRLLISFKIWENYYEAVRLDSQEQLHNDRKIAECVVFFLQVIIYGIFHPFVVMK